MDTTILDHLNRIFSVLSILLLILLINTAHAQYNDYANFPTEVNQWRGTTYFGTVFGAIGGLYLFADDAYYQDETVSFHLARIDGKLDWFDNYHRGIDKFGHIYSTSLFSQNFYFMARWSGYDNKSASWLAFSSSLLVLGAMEVWDAHFKRWGFSVGDFTANMIGAALPVAQQNISFMQNIDYKMSYNFLAQKSTGAGVHDYEHMTFWLTFNPAGFLKNWKPLQYISFLNIAIGYGLEKYSTQENEIYIALDYNFKRIKTKSAYLKHLIALLDRFHFPAPAIRIKPGFVGYGLFF